MKKNFIFRNDLSESGESIILQHGMLRQTERRTNYEQNYERNDNW